MEYYIERNGERRGPYTEAELRMRLSQGDLHASDRAVPTDGSAGATVGETLGEQPDSSNGEEKELWRGRVSLWHYFWYIVGGILLSVVLVGLVILGWVWLDRHRRLYLVTNRRVMLEYGILTKSTSEVRVADIRSVNVVEKGLLGMMGVGTVEFSSSGSGGVDVAFRDIGGAHSVREIVASMQS